MAGYIAGNISESMIQRLPVYYRHLLELEAEGVTRITSQGLADRMRLTSSQIRHDFLSFGCTGRQGCGYPVKELREQIRKISGLNRKHRMVVIGAGCIGRVIAGNAFFALEGFSVAALFDRDPASIALSTAAVPVYLEEELEERLPSLHAQIGILTPPAENAQEMLDRLYHLGIRAVWNLTPAELQFPGDMAIENMYLCDTLHILSYRINQLEEEFSGR